MSTPIVRTATVEDQRRLVSTIVLAFVSDPVARWVWPDPHQYLTTFPEFTEIFGGRAFEHGSALYADGFSGCGLWLPPHVAPDEEMLVALLEKSVASARLSGVFSVLEEMGRYHPTEPHWYLPLIGVEPTAQRRGYGSALMRHALERVDREGCVAYLESTNPANIPLYERHGFEVVGTIQVADAPPMFPMRRTARQLTSGRSGRVSGKVEK